MNVYQKEYDPQFIKKLPVDFNKMKNIDLNTIPQDYHILFMTDWNWGRYSTMPMHQRELLHELFLEYNHYIILAMKEEKLEKSSTKEEDIIKGFVKD